MAGDKAALAEHEPRASAYHQHVAQFGQHVDQIRQHDQQHAEQLNQDGQQVAQQPDREPVRSWRGVLKRLVRPALMLLMVAGVAAMVMLTASVSGTSWPVVGHELVAIRPGWLVAITVAWVAGLASFALVMIASLPGLSVRRAISLNLAGSAVANSLPLGGAISYGLTAAMARSWGFTTSAVTSFFTLTNLCNLLMRLLFGTLAIAWFVTLGPGLRSGATTLAVGCIASVVLVLLSAVLFERRAAYRLGRIASDVHHRFHRARKRHGAHVPDYATALVSIRFQIIYLLRTSWLKLVAGMTGYVITLGFLLDWCLRGLGVSPPLTLVLAVVCIERLVTAVPITPGGAGSAEVSLVACLVVAGIPSSEALAAALLYRLFTFAAEIPLGALVALGWQMSRKAAAAAATAPAERAASEQAA